MLTWWILLSGAVTTVLAFTAGLLRRAPLSTAVVYLGIGYAVGPYVLGLLTPRAIEVQVTGRTSEQEVAVDEKTAPAFMLLRMESFTENLERMGEAAVVVLLGALLRRSMFSGATFVFAALLFVVIRPLSVVVGFAGAGMNWLEKSMAAWFGMRGMASVYYLAYLLTHGESGSVVHQLADVAVGVITCSIVLHGVSVTPLMRWFERRKPEQEDGQRAPG